MTNNDAAMQLMYFLEMMRRDEDYKSVHNPDLKNRFQKWTSDIVDIINKEHTDHNCMLPTIIPTIEKEPLIISHRAPMVRAWVMPGKRDGIWINQNVEPEWTKQLAIRSIVHEAIHLTKDENGYYQLGPDSQYSEKPLGTLFGKTIHWSPDIDDAIFTHMKQHSTDPVLWKEDEFVKFIRQRNLESLRTMPFNYERKRF